MVRVGCMIYFQDHKWYDDLIDGGLKEKTLMHKARLEESRGHATLGVMKFCTWLKNSFEDFHELDYDVLVKLEECSWKVNTHEYAPFTRLENHGHKKEHEGKKHKLFSNPTHEPSACNVRRFEMIKYSFNADEEYVAVKELEYINHSRTNIDAAIRRIPGFGIRRIGLLYRPCCKEIKELVIVYSGKRRVLNSYGQFDTSSTHFCSRTQSGESSRAKYQGGFSF
ncbi:hypothetical protein Tco_0363076 [Tanacetum coccineum]